MAPDLLRDDCQNCAALCCIALAFDKSDMFAFDKPAGVACSHMMQSGGCGIHADRVKQGFTGCTRFSCNGAGQRVVQDCFDGKSWQQDGKLLAPMLVAFRDARNVHDLLLLLAESQKLALDPAQQEQADGLIAQLTPAGRMTESWLQTINNSNIKAKVYAFLGTLRAVASAPS